MKQLIFTLCLLSSLCTYAQNAKTLDYECHYVALCAEDGTQKKDYCVYTLLLEHNGSITLETHVVDPEGKLVHGIRYDKNDTYKFEQFVVKNDEWMGSLYSTSLKVYENGSSRPVILYEDESYDSYGPDPTVTCNMIGNEFKCCWYPGNTCSSSVMEVKRIFDRAHELGLIRKK